MRRIVVGAALLMAAPAVAAPRPRIDHLEDAQRARTTQFRAGYLLNLVGSGFHTCGAAPEGVDPRTFRCDHDGAQVRIDSKPVQVTTWSATLVTARIPQTLKPGKHSATIKVAGASATARFEVVLNKKSGDDGPRDPKVALLRQFTITRFAHRREKGKDHLDVEGGVAIEKLPKGTTITVEVFYGNELLRSDTPEVVNGTFKQAFTFTRPLPLGRYRAQIRFELGKQSKRVKRRWKSKLSKDQLEVYGRAVRHELTTVGTPQAIAAQNKRLQETANALSDVLERSLTQFRRAYASAGKSLFKEKSAARYDEAAWKKWVEDQDLDDDLGEIPVMASPRGHFLTKVFERWIAQDWLKPLNAAVNDFRADYGKTHIPAHPALVEAGEEAIGLVLVVFNQGVDQLYSHSGLQRPGSLTPPRTRILPAKPSLAAFRSLQKKMARQR